ncbi:MAG: GMP reductase [Chryseobacterium sp.]|jgi:GMP reductase
MQIINEIKLGFNDVLIKPKRSKTASRKDVVLSRSFKGLNSNSIIKGVPIIVANMDTVGTLKMAESLGKLNIFTCLHKFYELPILQKFFDSNEYSEFAFYTTGITDDDFIKLKEMKSTNRKINISIDVANGYTEHFQNKVKEIRSIFPDSFIMAGNVCTPEMVQELLLSGAADCIKVGIGGGSVCKTRMVTGVGYPQLSAVIECAEAAHGLNGLICSDGGCKESGDVAKAFGAGSDFVMLGGMFAGTDECEGEWIFEDDTKYLKFYGMSSEEANNKYCGGMKDYRASEGEVKFVGYKGSAETVVNQILGGLRSACAYVGANQLKDLSKCTTFVRCNSIK